MNKFLILFALLFLPAHASIPIEVLKVYDGDTIKVKLDSGNKFSIRLQGIDCYETSRIHRAYKQAYEGKVNIDEVIKKGNEAKSFLKSLYKKSNDISFDFMGVDKYGRVLGIVYFDNLNINEELLKKKVCMPYVFKEK